MSRTGWIWTIVVVVILIVAAVWYMNRSNATVPTGTSNTAAVPTDQTGATASGTLNGTVQASPSAGSEKTVTVTYNGSSFSPASVTIANGDTVTFVDSGSRPMWIASDPHPTHTAYDGTSRSQHCAAGYTGAKPFDECAAGTSFSFTFTKSGTFGYHDHMNNAARGTIVVQ